MASKDPYSLRGIFEEMTLNLIASMKRNLSRHEEEEERVGLSLTSGSSRRKASFVSICFVSGFLP